MMAQKPTKKSGKKRKKKSNLVPVLLLILSLLLLSYPVVGTLYNNEKLAEKAQSYKDKVTVEPESSRNGSELDKADEYNEWLKTHPFTPPTIGDEVSDEKFRKYSQIINSPENTMGTVTIPSIDVNLPIYHGTSPDVLHKGVGHLYGTSLPVGGDGTMSALSAHTGMVNASMFDNLPQLQQGDKAYVQVRDRRLAYKMVSSSVVPPSDTDALPHPGEHDDLLVLITCTPYGLNTDRLIVVMERTPLDDKDFDASNQIRIWTWWMTVVVILAALVILFLALIARDEYKKAKKNSPKKIAPTRHRDGKK